MKYTLPLVASAVVALAALNSVSAQEDAKERLKNSPIFISTDVLMGCKAQWPGDQEDSVKDALLNTSSGRIAGLIMESGAVASFDCVRWNPEKNCFSCTETNARVVEASSSRGDRKPRSGETRASSNQSLNNTFLLSSVVSFPLIGYERTEEGLRNEAELGSVGGAFIDTRSGCLAYVTTSVGGVLGIGAESRVIPWSAVRIDRNEDGEHRLSSDINAERLEKAPAFGGGAHDLNNPEYRNTLYSYYGTRRADFEPVSTDDVCVVPVDEMLGATIVRGSDDEDSLKDLVLDPESGQVSLAICANGNVVPASSLSWNAMEKQFRVSGDVKPVEMDPAKKQLLASALADFRIICDTEECGDLEDVYFDTNSGKLAYLSFDYDGVRVLPWSTVTLNTSAEEPSIQLSCAKSSLKNAPELDGEMGATIYSPAFRERVSRLESKKQ